MPVPLPIDDVLPELVAALRSNNCAVLKADAGAGKTTRVPLALLRAGFTSEQTSHVGSPLGDQQIVMLEPRRIAARTSARRIASETGEQVGQTIGYRVRFDEAVSASTRVLIVTEGILLRRLQDDPFLEDIGVVVFDEFHERRLDSDLALAMVRRVQQTVRPDLRIVVMSATMDPGPVSHWLGNCPVIESRGRTFPVRVEYLRRTDRIPLPTLAAQGVEHVLAQTDGDILVFLPGVGEIMKTQRELDSLARRHNIAIMPLYGDLSSEEQDQVLAHNVRRKIVLATNVAETSITIDGITAVVDSGYARQMHFDADVGLDRLEMRPVSKASADQRAGRAGRTRPGVCLRLWDESAYRTRADYDQAELHRVDLSAAVLRLHAWGEKNVALFPWFESPPETALRHADRLLRLLGAMDDNGVTAHGQAMVRFPTSPRIARLLIETQNHGLGRRGALLAALLTERDPFVAGNGPVAGKTPAARSQSDVLDRLLAFESFQQTGNPVTSFGTIHRANARTIQLVARQFERVQKDSEYGSDEFRNQADEWILRSLVAAFPDRIAKRREPGSDRGLMIGGRGVRFGSQSSVRQCELFLCVDTDGRGTDALIRKTSEVRREWLPSSLIRTVDELFFHPTQKSVTARRRTYMEDLLLDETPTAVEDTSEAAEILFQAAKSNWSSVFPSDDVAVAGFCTRLACLTEWMPELNLPALGGTELQEILREICQGRRSFSEVRRAPWLAVIQSRLDYAAIRTIEREAPESILVPSGSRIRLVYESGRPPVLPVRIQEMFGLRQTPRVAGGRIAVLLHLLAPNMRPQQVTDDLASFWANTYPEVRKELKRRYPKHSWPEDPLTAEAVSGAKRRQN